MTSLGYPADFNGNPGPTDAYTYDQMGRLNNYGATWGPAGELLTFNNQTRTYNNLGQLTRIFNQVQTGWQGTQPVYTTTMDMQYNYTAGQNNGRVAQTVDGVTGETVNYGYDSLNRLATAQASSWGQSYSYDGWGNLNGKTVTYGSAPTYSANPDPSRNGGPDPAQAPNPAVDVENRYIGTEPLYTSAGQSYTYDQSGKMVFTLSVSLLPNGDDGNPVGTYPCEIHFFGITGQRLAKYSCFYAIGGGPPSFQYSVADYPHKTLGILTHWGGKDVTTDRLGTIRADGNGGRYTYYPYGEVKTAPSGQTGLYGDLEDPLRVYDSNGARWGVPDPLGMKAAVLTNPTTWNRYAYANGDPVNLNDPRGLCPPGYVEANSDQMESVVNTAESYLGQSLTHADNAHYVVSGGVLSAIDCTGLVAQALAGIAYTQTNFQAPSKADQFTTYQIPGFFSQDSTWEVGDIISFGTHAGIVKSVDANGNVTSFIGSQNSTGPAIVDLTDPTKTFWRSRMKSAKAYKPCVPAPTQAGGSGPASGGELLPDPGLGRSGFDWMNSLYGGGGTSVTSTISYEWTFIATSTITYDMSQ